MLVLRAAVLLVMVSIALTSCSRQDSSFDQEQAAIRGALPSNASYHSSPTAKQTGYSVESSWKGDFAGSIEAAKKAFQGGLPSSYKLVRETENELTYAKYDDHDEFDLMLTFTIESERSTAIQLVLRSNPD